MKALALVWPWLFPSGLPAGEGSDRRGRRRRCGLVYRRTAWGRYRRRGRRSRGANHCRLTSLRGSVHGLVRRNYPYGSDLDRPRRLTLSRWHRRNLLRHSQYARQRLALVQAANGDGRIQAARAQTASWWLDKSAKSTISPDLSQFWQSICLENGQPARRARLQRDGITGKFPRMRAHASRLGLTAPLPQRCFLAPPAGSGRRCHVTCKGPDQITLPRHRRCSPAATRRSVRGAHRQEGGHASCGARDASAGFNGVEKIWL
jgi:hypothetical protein